MQRMPAKHHRLEGLPRDRGSRGGAGFLYVGRQDAGVPGVGFLNGGRQDAGVPGVGFLDVGRQDAGVPGAGSGGRNVRQETPGGGPDSRVGSAVASDV